MRGGAGRRSSGVDSETFPRKKSSSSENTGCRRPSAFEMLALKNDELMDNLDGGKIIIVRGPFIDLNGIEVPVGSKL